MSNNKKQYKMKTIEKLQKQLEETKRSIKFANACEIIIDAINNKSEYTIPTYNGMKYVLFESEYFTKYGTFEFSESKPKHFIEVYKIVNENKKLPLKFTKVLNAMKFVYKNEDLIDIATKIRKENE